MQSYPMKKANNLKIYTQSSSFSVLLFYNSAPISGGSIQQHFPERSYLYPTIPHPPPPSLFQLPPPSIFLLQILSLLIFPGSSKLFSFWTEHLFSDLKFWWHLSSLRDHLLSQAHIKAFFQIKEFCLQVWR